MVFDGDGPSNVAIRKIIDIHNFELACCIDFNIHNGKKIKLSAGRTFNSWDYFHSEDYFQCMHCCLPFPARLCIPMGAQMVGSGEPETAGENKERKIVKKE